MSTKAVVLQAVGNVSIFGWLENLDFWKALPYPIKGALLRGLKAGLSVIVAALLTAATAGTLFPVTWGPAVIVLLTTALQALDKYIREWNIDVENTEANSGIPTADPVTPEIPSGDAAKDLPPVNTDATVAVPPQPVVEDKPTDLPEGEVVLDDTNDPVSPEDLPDNT